jgi:serine/threonine-protein kinase
MEKFLQWLKEHKNIFYGIGITAAVLLVFIFIMDAVVMPLYTKRGSEHEVPDITELTFTEAEEILKENGFNIVKKDDQFHPTYPESTVIQQDPQPFSKTKKGRRIYVTLSAGERKVRVPRVIGKSERDAIYVLQQAGLHPGDIFYEFHSYYQKGVVCNQAIVEDQEVVALTVVDITVSNGPLPDKFVVPDLRGKSLETAVTLLRKAGLSVGYVSYQTRKNLIPETVINQSIDPAQEVVKGQPVNLIVSRLPESSM